MWKSQPKYQNLTASSWTKIRRYFWGNSLGKEVHAGTVFFTRHLWKVKHNYRIDQPNTLSGNRYGITFCSISTFRTATGTVAVSTELFIFTPVRPLTWQLLDIIVRACLTVMVELRTFSNHCFYWFPEVSKHRFFKWQHCPPVKSPDRPVS